MQSILVRVLILALAGALSWLAVWIGRRFVERRRQAALAATGAEFDSGTTGAPVRILAFSSADCTQCHRLQRPALRRVQDALGEDTVEVVEIDGPSSPELTKRYNVLTVPTTVVLDASGHAHAVNFGFANAQKLLSQVDTVLTGARAAS
ncbi:MAG TPA: thioredoxin family protein [Ktedonobacterales bacterium]|nr:thioredoxin family protein [Ktedonobacterales bacterium]